MKVLTCFDRLTLCCLMVDEMVGALQGSGFPGSGAEFGFLSVRFESETAIIYKSRADERLIWPM